MIKRLSTRLWHVTTSIPPIRPENVLPIVIMMILWVVLRQLAISEDNAFVVSVVVAEAYAIWRNLPNAAYSLKKVESGKPGMLRWPVALLIVLAALQLWLNNPLFTQRVLTGFSVFFLLIMVFGIRREKDLLDRVAPIAENDSVTVERVSLLRINALAAAMVVGVNELLIAFETLSVWITVMPVFVLVLHAFYWFMVLMALPPDESAV